jgi:hypothetical protein
MSITFHNPLGPSAPTPKPAPTSPQMTGPSKAAPGMKPQKPKNPAEVFKKKRDLQKKQTEIQTQIRNLHMAGRILGKFVQAIPVQNDPNEDPIYLFSQIRPLLGKLRLANLCIDNKTQLMTGQSRGKDSSYCVFLRRTTQITSDIINRIKMNLNQFQYLVWSENAIEIYLWYPYVPPPQQQTPTTGTPA